MATPPEGLKRRKFKVIQLPPAAPPQAVERLARAYRMSVGSRVASRRLELAEAEHNETERKKDNRETNEMAAPLNKVKPPDARVDSAAAMDTPDV